MKFLLPLKSYKKSKNKKLLKIAYNSLLDLSSEQGINASGRDGVYGCVFGRDSAITILKILQATAKNPDPKLTAICQKGLYTLINLQGKEKNIESGEEPGKFIHEFRKPDQGIERLINRQIDPNKPWENPWYVYPDQTVRSYDSIDSTPLGLVAIYRYYQQNKKNDKQFLINVMPGVEAGLNWIISSGDLDKDYLLEYEIPPEREHGGLRVQSWTDSQDCLLRPDGSFPNYPIAPVEVQGYAWLALKLWADFYQNQSPAFSQKLSSQADALKKRFNEIFIIKDQGLNFAAQALDGDKYPIKTITGNPLLLLWSTYFGTRGKECIIEHKYIDDFVERAFQDDLFDESAGIRTMSTASQTFNPNQNSYHNGSFWPVLNGMIHEGLLNWSYTKKAKLLHDASIKPLEYFETPIELYLKGAAGEYLEYLEPEGQAACKVQAWTAAVMLDMLTEKQLTAKIAQSAISLWKLPFSYLPLKVS